MRALALLAGVLAFAVITDVPAKIYKWVDNEGQVHYGQQPPNGVDAEPMSVHTAPASSGGGSNGASTSRPERRDEAVARSEEGDSEAASEEERIAKNCKTARQNLNVLETSGPGGRFRRPDGDIVSYDEEQWQARVDRNRKYIQVYCEEKSQ